MITIPEKLVETLEGLSKPAIIAVSGFGGAGKSTFAKKLGEKLNAPVVGVDSFQQESSFETDYKLWEVMDFDRLEIEVLKPFKGGQQKVTYGHFDSTYDDVFKTSQFTNDGILVVEGVGLFRPNLLEYFDYKIWVDCPLDEAIVRGKKRDREEYNNPKDELWDSIWKCNDEECFNAYKPLEIADYIFKNC